MKSANSLYTFATRGLVTSLFFLGMTNAINTLVASPSPQAEKVGSLKNKSDQELLDIVRGQNRAMDQQFEDEHAEDRVRFSSLDQLWEMPPQQAALALIQNYVSKESNDARFKLDDPNAKPPKNGEIGLRWISGNEYAPPQHGVMILKHDGWKSQLLVSQVEIAGKASKEEIEEAVMKTDSHPLPRLVAQQTYEIIWWLRHVRIDHEPKTWSSSTLSSNDDFGSFWMKPQGPELKEVIFSYPCGQCIDTNYPTAVPSFAEVLIRRVMERSGIKSRYPVPKIGQPIDNDPDSVFVRSEPPPLPGDEAGTKKWVSRMIDILRNPERDFLYCTVMEILVPISDPLRYNDERIDSALLDVLHRSKEAAAKVPTPEREPAFDPDTFPDEEAEKKARDEREQKRRKARALEWHRIELEGNATTAAMKLGLHDAVPAFSEILDIAPIQAAAIIARHPELHAQFANFLHQRTPDPAKGDPSDGTVEMIWRADLREFAPWLGKLAKTPPPKDEPTADQWIGARHEAKLVLLAWNEPDPLTKTKLDIMLTGKLGGSGTIPEVLRLEFEKLSKNDQATIRAFVNWMRTVDVPWSRRYIENFFTPHTPRPDLLFER